MDIKILMTVSVLVARIGNKVLLPINKLMVRLWNNQTLKYYATASCLFDFKCFIAAAAGWKNFPSAELNEKEKVENSFQ